MKKIICTTLLIEDSPQSLPLGVACITSELKKYFKNEHEIKLIVFNKENLIKNSIDEEKAGIYIAEKLLKESPDIICFSVFVWNRIVFEKTASILKTNKIITIAGGPEITSNPSSIKNFNYLITKQGEIKVPLLIEKIIKEKETNFDKCINADSLFTNNPLFFSSPNLEKLSSPYLDGTLNPQDYSNGVLWELARGCPFNCSYCFESKGENKVTYFPLERIKKELDFFAEKKVSQVFVLDPTYNANKKRAIELLNLIAKKTPNTFYYFEARAEFIDKEMAHAFSKITCSLQIGLQSANENVLKTVNRSFNKNLFIKNINYLNREGIIFGFDLIYGLPNETFKSFKNGIDFALNLYPNNLEIFRLSVLPGTKLYDQAKNLNLNFLHEPPYTIINTDVFSKEELDKAEKLSFSCNYFYNMGRAVPWFNTICNALHIKPTVLLEKFYSFAKENLIDITNCNYTHKEIEINQLNFIKKILTSYHQEKLIKATQDIIIFNGAFSRVLDTGNEEVIHLNYDIDYISSEYSSDLIFFTKNCPPSKCKAKIFISNNGPDYKKIK